VPVSKTFEVSTLQGKTFLGVGVFGGLLSSGLILGLVLEGGLVRTGLTDGVVSFALSVHSLLDGLEVEARIVVLVLKAHRVGLTVHVSFEDEVGSNRVDDDLGDLGPLDVDERDGEVLLNLDGDWDALLEGDDDGGLKGSLHFRKELHLLPLLHVAFSGVEFLLGLVNLDIFGLRELKGTKQGEFSNVSNSL
jgi:hypothetical protein